MGKSGIFGPKFKDFYFCTKLCNKTNSRALISNITMVFLNCCPKQPIKAFLVSNLRIFIFGKLCNQTNSRALISNMTMDFFYNVYQLKNTRIKDFLS